MPTLWCESGKHSWERDSQRGRPPRDCPQHRRRNPDEPAEGERFTEEERAADRVMVAMGFENPTFPELKSALEKFGVGGILESARHLPEEQYERLEELVRRAPSTRRWNRRTKRYEGV